MSTIYISKNANTLLKNYLIGEGHRIAEVFPMAPIDEPISCHADIYMCDLGRRLFHGNPALLKPTYPGHAIYNGCSTGKYFIHNSKITSSALAEAVAEEGLTTIHVSQGYTKCSCVVVDENSIITSDLGIVKATKNAGLNVLCIDPAQVVLDGYPYGFIGGASGKIGNTIVFNGDISRHSNYIQIKKFIEERELEMVYFREYALTDIGSVIEDRES